MQRHNEPSASLRARNRLDGVYLVVLGCLVSFLLGVVMEISTPTSMLDFHNIYYSARCLLHHQDPYKYGAPLQECVREGHPLPSDPMDRRVFHDLISCSVYPPNALILFLPIALLPFAGAHTLWMALTILSFALACALTWEIASARAPRLAGLIIGFLLANNILVIASGNPAGIVVSFCVIAVWCLVHRRFIWVGLICLVIALEVKPHDAIWIWSFFLLAGIEYRKRAIQSLIAALVIAIAAMLLTWHIAPGWPAELRSNVASIFSPGGFNDPNLSAAGYYTVNQIITLQSALSFFHNDSAFYNSLTYFICLPLLLLWAWITLRSRSSRENTWLALAAIIPLAMLPVYHRPYDAKLLMLAVPACVMWWIEDGRIGKVAVALNSIAILVSADLPWIILKAQNVRFHIPEGPSAPRSLVFIWVVPIPLVLLVTGAFNLWMYGQRVRRANMSSVLTPRASVR